ncbi:unnamed protein product [Leptidea sinapis]|uniref:Uncharacterized protein n=1 Tax=Leptidea sinapis TaxID=189913 RepID=A0A5E4QA66_9NEOP|nr:unnamed protein product [Leptidea sinapis]
MSYLDYRDLSISMSNEKLCQASFANLKLKTSKCWIFDVFKSCPREIRDILVDMSCGVRSLLHTCSKRLACIALHAPDKKVAVVSEGQGKPVSARGSRCKLHPSVESPDEGLRATSPGSMVLSLARSMCTCPACSVFQEALKKKQQPPAPAPAAAMASFTALAPAPASPPPAPASPPPATPLTAAAPTYCTRRLRTNSVFVEKKPFYTSDRVRLELSPYVMEDAPEYLCCFIIFVQRDVKRFSHILKSKNSASDLVYG